MTSLARSPVTAVVLAWLFLPLVALAEIVIDPLVTAQTGTTSLDLAEALGGERDLEQVAEANTATVGGGMLTCVGNGQFNGCVLEWDGDDDDPINTNFTGFSPVDFTADGVQEVRVPTRMTSGNCSLFVRLCDDTTQCAQQSSLMPAGVGQLTFSLATFSGIDQTSIVGVLIAVSPQAVPADCALGVPVVRKTPIFENGFEGGNLNAWSAHVP